jgi:glycosyltransferase involved in cell wall biosynthesis
LTSPSAALDVVIAGPVPPPAGGVTGFVALLSEAAAPGCRSLRVFDTSSHSNPSDAGTWSAANVLGGVGTSGRIAWQLRRETADVLQVEAGGYLGLLKAAGLVLASGHRAPVLSLHSPHIAADVALARPAGARVIAAAIRRCVAIRCMFGQQAADVTALVPEYPPDRFEIIRPFIPAGDREVVDPERRIATQPVRVLSVGTVGRRKGTFELLEAVARVRSSGLDLHCIVLGDEEREGELAELEAVVANHDLQGVVELRGRVPGEVVAQELADADIFALPSLAEGLPLAIMEAMRAGLPLLVTAVGALPEAIDQPELPPLPPGDVDALSDALARLVSDEPLRVRCARANLDRVQSHLSPASVVPHFLAMWERAASRR